ncbi:FAD-dependent monooxygenase [Serratia ficaria]|uniref:Ubiquinone biosynthesis hydroxylase, UbiH/UbiF/VisC/COQ6 family n=1 Tax=Serratia ficaria TaxID=61651 RepID=A0A240AM35_SERFI|nr:FAD-dependent monooxygenase [Serratia ficaria]REF42002.1 2-polyprenyl-6-methoxyphenol hydroxylase-like FAD-dependent oxidoreductase [Serratia ficaria]CAI0942236.1 ubiquinone biosynthesis hydroxylase, UbiH/UbiF/VisC/COQ6 family [Serratia ficaria]CAI0958134.1 ubiquinone biosynthesis hydroxylase, UbiH/UbiF/VisC/COQ6 family [Serratia ficaria]CAI1038802.1 ubiquinone biosynthesis hydroxylase, UbiH/UbiF/VisC/COQ6 family [Serratia ficaria]CAI2063747.1 ubiquinone biosynthesis hydroxylase, UbiH/UbiF/
MSDEIVIIGGSLTGLTLALACAKYRIPVRVIERSAGHILGGDSLSIDLDLVATTTGYDPRAQPVLPVVPAYRELTTWPALYAWLRTRTIETHSIVLEESKNVTAISDMGEYVNISFSDGSERNAAAVIGADGYRSLVRQTITQEDPFATYSGYLVWRGLVEERELERSVAWSSNGGLWIEFVEGYRLVAATLPGRDGSLKAGERQITFAWFDTHQGTLLHQSGCLTEEGHVIGSLVRGKIDSTVRAELADIAKDIWPPLWREAVVKGVLSHAVLSGAPIAEYNPPRLAKGALAIVGDAAHVVSPMTGRGYLTGVEDAAMLAQMLSQRASDEPISTVFKRFEIARLPYIRGLVTHSMRISDEFVRYAKYHR